MRAIVLVFSLVLGCRRSDPVEPPVVPPVTVIDAAVELPPLEDGCNGEQTPGWLSAERGQLVFWPSESPSGGPNQDGEVARMLVGDGYRPFWRPRRVMLRRGTDEWFSTSLPGTGSSSVIAVRTIYGEQHVEGRDELVEIAAGTMTTQILWSPGRRLLLLGRSGRSVVMLTFDGKVARVVGFDLESRAIVESAPVDLDLDALTIRSDALYHSWRLDPVDAGNEWSSCSGPNDYVLRCRGRLCRARLEGERITITNVVLEPCAELNDHEYRRGLPVDGRMLHAVPVEIDACAIRTNLEFPSLDHSEPCRVEVVDHGGPDSLPWFRELHVTPGCTISTGFSGFAFALPPDQVEIEPLPDLGLWRVQLPFPDSAFDDGDCRQGELWLRRLDWSQDAREETWLDWDYGFCE